MIPFFYIYIIKISSVTLDNSSNTVMRTTFSRISLGMCGLLWKYITLVVV